MNENGPSLTEAFHRADVESERLVTFSRMAILAVLTLTIAVASAAGSHHHPLIVATVIYGVGTFIGLVAIWRRLFHVMLPYVFVAFDTLTLAFAILVLGRSLGLPPDQTFALPVSGLVLIVLLQASMRYRPGLVLFAAGLFVTASLLGAAFFAWFDPLSDSPGSDENHLVHYRVFPVAIFGLTAVILYLTTRRTRRFIADAYADANRAAALSRYFSPEIAEELAKRSEGNPAFGQRQKVTVVFADIQGFTAMAEAIDPAELGQFLSSFRARISAPAARYGGVVDKYIGDAVMVVFGAPHPRTDDAARALTCALAMVDAMDEWSRDRLRRGRGAVAVSIAAHFGDAFAGVLSDGRLLEYTVIGDTVNVASRLMRLPRELDTPLVLSAALVDAAGALPDRERWEMLQPQVLSGHPRTFPIYRLRPDAVGS